jgi:hypothetical protein
VVRGAGNSPSGVKRVEIWIDGSKRYQRWNDQVVKSLTLPHGQHRISVVAVDRYKGSGGAVSIINVK